MRARPRTQSSLAIRGGDGPWFLVNASPDARQQLEALTEPEADGVRAAPVAGVLLTDAEIDHTAGLLLLRESATPVRVYGERGGRGERSARVTRCCRSSSVIPAPIGRRWRSETRDRQLDGSSLTVEPFEVGGDAPRLPGRLRGRASRQRLAVPRSRATGGVLSYVPGLARLDDGVLARFAASDLVLVDGTFWRDDELARLGISARSARDMGHLPLSGPGGTLEALAALERPRKALVHINNTNPILLEDSPERAEVVAPGSRLPTMASRWSCE